MYLPLILFFLSLTGIVIMIWRELILVRKGQVALAQHSHPFVPELQKIKNITFKSSKKFGYTTIFLTLKFFIKSSNFIKTRSVILAKEIKDKFKKKNGIVIEKIEEKKEPSKYLKIISEYREKIREIKDRIKEEEGIE